MNAGLTVVLLFGVPALSMICGPILTTPRPN